VACNVFECSIGKLVIRVHYIDPPALGGTYTIVDRTMLASILSLDENNDKSTIELPLPNKVGSSICRSIIDNEPFEIGIGLRF